MKNGLIFLFLILSLNLKSQVVLNDSFKSSTLENQMSIFRDSSNSLKIEDIIKNSEKLSFKISKISVPSFGYDSSHIWVNFQVKNISRKPLYIYLRINRSYLDISDFYLVHENEILKKIPFNWKTPYYERENQSKLPSGQFLLEPMKTYEIYILAQKKGVTWSFPIEVFSKKSFFEREKFENYSLGLLSGGMIMTVLMSIFLFYLSKENIYFFYSCYSVFSTLTVLSLGGYLNHLFGHKIRILTGIESQYFYIVGFALFNILFTHHFFLIHKNGPKWLFYLGKFTISLCIIHEIIFILDYNFVYRIKLMYIFILFATVIIITLLVSLKRGNILAKIYLFAFLPLFTILVIMMLSELRLISQPFILPLFGPPSVLFEIYVLLIGLTYRLYDFQRKKQLLEKEIITINIQTQETERKRIAQDLHDDLGGTLSAIKGKVSNEIQNPETLNLIEKAIEDLRGISRNLLPPELNKNGLSKAIQQSIERLQNSGGVSFTFICFGTEFKLSEEKELNIYRVVSELLNNIVKHSKASKSTIQLIYYDNYLTMLIEDNGIGIKNNEKDLGIGLKNVNSRIEFLKASLVVDTSNYGSTFTIEIPFS